MRMKRTLSCFQVENKFECSASGVISGCQMTRALIFYQPPLDGDRVLLLLKPITDHTINLPWNIHLQINMNGKYDQLSLYLFWSYHCPVLITACNQSTIYHLIQLSLNHSFPLSSSVNTYTGWQHIAIVKEIHTHPYFPKFNTGAISSNDAVGFSDGEVMVLHAIRFLQSLQSNTDSCQ